MSSELKPYPKYKDSGVEWIGEVPEEWGVVSLTRVLDSIVDYRGKTPEKVEKGVFLVTAKNVKSGVVDYQISREFVRSLDYDEIMRRGKPKLGDVLFTTEAPLGEVANVDEENIALAQRIIKFRGKERVLENYYLKYWIMSQGFQDNLQTFATGSTAQGIKSSKLGQLLVILPSYSEQTTISDYLSNKTSEIEALIADKEKLISLLEEKRQAVITETVTKGLDPNVKMKDSGIEWIGKIPEHWEVSKLKLHSKIIMGQSIEKSDSSLNEKDVPFLQGNAEFGSLNPTASKFCKVGKKHVKENDILLSVRAPVGALNIADKEYAIGRGLSAIRVESKFKNYYWYALKVFKEELLSKMTGSTFEAVTIEDVKNMLFILPSKSEIINIAEKLKTLDEYYNKTILNLNTQISKLKEYRESLIYEAVTGKIDLRDYGEESDLLVAERGETYGN